MTNNYKQRRHQQGGAVEFAKAPEPYQLVTIELPSMSKPVAYPADWAKGQLLNVRNVGSEYGPQYQVTVLEEAPDPDRPHRTLHFTDGFECQAFVSWWYSGNGTVPLR